MGASQTIRAVDNRQPRRKTRNATLTLGSFMGRRIGEKLAALYVWQCSASDVREAILEAYGSATNC